jgi:hypothetical protein
MARVTHIIITRTEGHRGRYGSERHSETVELGLDDDPIEVAREIRARIDLYFDEYFNGDGRGGLSSYQAYDQLKADGD